MRKYYSNKKQAESAGASTDTIYLGRSGIPYYWRICPGCKKLKLVGSRNTFCSSVCSNKFKFVLASPISDAKEDYSKVHSYISKQKVRTVKCSICHEQRTTQWAYLGGDPLDLDNYLELCVPCHTRFDVRRVASLHIRKHVVI